VNIDALKLECKGKWEGIFNHFGIDVGRRHQPCPYCGGEDRFRFDNKFGDGNYFCNQCGAGDGLSLIQKCTGIQFPDLIKRVSGVVGMVEEKKENTVDDIEARRKNLRSLWSKSKKLTGSDPVMNYLMSRKITLTPDDVMFCPQCYESETKKEIPAMVAIFKSKDGQPIGMHRTYLNGPKKADIKNPKKMMPPLENQAGGAVRLLSPGGMFEKETLGIAEGIETALSAAQMFMVATWACLSTTLLEKFEPPPNVRKFVIFSDNDANYSGQKAAYTLAQRLYQKNFIVDVVLPNLSDFNDELKEGMARQNHQI